jgi:hypothetical protein
LLLLLSACQTLGIGSADTFNKKLAGGYQAVTASRDLAATLLTSGKITADDAQNVNNQADNFRAGLDVARSVHATNPTAGADKLASILTGLNALSAYLATREK